MRSQNPSSRPAQAIGKVGQALFVCLAGQTWSCRARNEAPVRPRQSAQPRFIVSAGDVSAVEISLVHLEPEGRPTTKTTRSEDQSAIATLLGVINKGEVVAFGRPDAVLTSDNLRLAYKIKLEARKNPKTGKIRVYSS